MLRSSFLYRCAAFISRTIKLDDGTIMEGQFSPSVAEHDGSEAAKGFSKGSVTLADGRVFSGDFDQGRPVSTTKLVEDGDVYQGSFNAQWQRHGAGRAWLQDGTTYDGEFLDDELVKGTVAVPTPSGGQVVFTGTLKDEQFVHGTLRQDNFVYTGSFANNEPHGRGKLEFDTGALHDGTFFRGKLHGEGCKMRLENGVVYLGSFLDGAIAEGEMRTPTFTYEGHFAPNGMAHGVGRCEYLTTSPRLVFIGDWLQGKFVGGNVVDEYGAPVDSRTASEQVTSPDDMMISEHANAQYEDTRVRYREMNSVYVDDAAGARAAGKPSDKIDLGYEHGPTTTAEISSRRELEYTKQLDERKARLSSDCAAVDEAKRSIDAIASEAGSVVDHTKATQLAATQRAQQQQTRSLMEEQFKRFQRSGGAVKSSTDSNEAWTGLVK